MLIKKAYKIHVLYNYYQIIDLLFWGLIGCLEIELESLLYPRNEFENTQFLEVEKWKGILSIADRCYYRK